MRDRHRLAHVGIGVTFVALLFSSPLTRIAAAQDVPQPLLTAQFSFSNPGARSLGLGGAFVALADDATAAWANPAGLVQIARPELSAEGRYWSYSSPFVVSGRIRGAATGVGLDTNSGLMLDASDYDTSGLAFLSFVYPKGRLSLAFYRHILANLETTGETQGLFSETDGGQSFRFLDQRNNTRLESTSYGFSGGYRVTDTLSLGLGLIYYQTTVEIESDLFLWDDLNDPFGSGTSYRPDRFVIGQTLFGDDWSMGFSAGLLWRFAPQWSLGGRYRQGPRVEINGEGRIGSFGDFGFLPGSAIQLGAIAKAEFPDDYGLGVAYRSEDGHLTIGFEWARVTYSDALESLEVDDQNLDDADELHLGCEWAFLNLRPILAARAGLWLDPDHQTRANEKSDDFTRALLQPSDDNLHYSFGLGLAFDRFQVDAAVDVSDLVNTFSLSAIYGF